MWPLLKSLCGAGHLFLGVGGWGGGSEFKVLLIFLLIHGFDTFVSRGKGGGSVSDAAATASRQLPVSLLQHVALSWLGVLL